jgi:hypothetical protein
MTWVLRPAVREDTPLIIGVAGPTKSGKTYSAHRLAIGLAPAGGRIIMLNAEGRRGHQYADVFKYEGVDIAPPYSPERYEDAVAFIKTQHPAVLIVDSASHMHDGPGGLLEYHDAELDRIAGQDETRRQKASGTAWIKPKRAENAFIYTMLGLECPVILCFRAKEKYELPSYRSLGWQPIAGDRITFETLFTLVLPPHSKGVPDMKQSELRDPFDAMIPAGRPLDEELGRRLAEWARGKREHAQAVAADPRAKALADISALLKSAPEKSRRAIAKDVFGVDSLAAIQAVPLDILTAALQPIEGSSISQIEAAVIAEKERVQ